MQVFKIKAPDDWADVGAGEIIGFPANKAGRKIQLVYNVTGRVDVFGAENADMEAAVLLASADGMFQLEVTARNDFYVEVRPQKSGKASPVIFMRTSAPDHTVSAVADEKFTTVERRSTKSPELARMENIMRHNERIRDKQLSAEREAVRAEMAELRSKLEVNLEQENPSVLSEPDGGREADIGEPQGVDEDGEDLSAEDSRDGA